MSPANYERLLRRFEALLDRVESSLPAEPGAPPWDASIAFRWRKHEGRAALRPVARPHQIRLEDLQGIDRQKALV